MVIKILFQIRNAQGVRYEVHFRKPNVAHYGEAVDAASSKKILPRFTNPYLTQKSELNTIVHEICHAFFWDKSRKSKQIR